MSLARKLESLKRQQARLTRLAAEVSTRVAVLEGCVKPSTAERIQGLLRKADALGPLSVTEIATVLELPVNTVSVTLARHKRWFRRVGWGLYELKGKIHD